MNTLFEVTEKVRAIGLYQPFASLMLHGKLETRNKPTNVRGKVLIYSTQKRYNQAELFNLCGPEILYNISKTLENEITKNYFGYGIAMGYLIGCRRMKKVDEEKAFVRFDQTKWVWIFENVKRIIPIPFTGSQGWQFVNEEILNQISKLT